MNLNQEFYAPHFSATYFLFSLSPLYPTATFHPSCGLISNDYILTHPLFHVFSSKHCTSCIGVLLLSYPHACATLRAPWSSVFLLFSILCCLPLIMTLSLVRFSSTALSSVCALCLLFLVLSSLVLTTLPCVHTHFSPSLSLRLSY